MIIWPCGWLKLPVRVNLQPSSLKMVMSEIEATATGQGLGWFGYDVDEVFQRLKGKTHEPK